MLNTEGVKLLHSKLSILRKKVHWAEKNYTDTVCDVCDKCQVCLEGKIGGDRKKDKFVTFDGSWERGWWQKTADLLQGLTHID